MPACPFIISNTTNEKAKLFLARTPIKQNEGIRLFDYCVLLLAVGCCTLAEESEDGYERC